MGLYRTGTMAAGTLYTYPENFRAYKALIAAQFSGAEVAVAGDFKFGETNKTDAFLKKFPLGKVPAFEGTDGTWLFESNAIAYYVASESLRGASLVDQAFVQQWVSFADNELLPASCTWVFPTLGIMQYNKQNTERSKEEVKKALGLLNKHLETRTFLVGERITLADISVACNPLLLYQHVLEPSFREPFLNVNRWFVTLVNQPQFKKVIGEFTLCAKMAQFDAKKFAELQGNEGKGKAKQEKAKAPKQEKPKQEKKPAPAAEAEEEEEEPKPKPSKDPFAALPAGTFVMDVWKKMYSNNECDVSMPWFWENFDKENYSIWYCEYMYPEDLTLVFMSCNLIGGFFQRLDRLRKHGFGSVAVFGENNKSTISGVWCWRGQDLAFELSDDLKVDYGSYSWKKLDFDSPADRKLVEEYWREEGEFGGKKYNQGKCFK